MIGQQTILTLTNIKQQISVYNWSTPIGKLTAGSLLCRLAHAVKPLQDALTDIYHSNCKSILPCGTCKCLIYPSCTNFRFWQIPSH